MVAYAAAPPTLVIPAQAGITDGCPGTYPSGQITCRSSHKYDPDSTPVIARRFFLAVYR